MFLTFSFLDVSYQANLLLSNMKEIIEKLQSDNYYFQTQVKNLQIENKHLTIPNKNLSKELSSLKENLKRKNYL